MSGRSVSLEEDSAGKYGRRAVTCDGTTHKTKLTSARQSSFEVAQLGSGDPVVKSESNFIELHRNKHLSTREHSTQAEDDRGLVGRVEVFPEGNIRSVVSGCF